MKKHCSEQAGIPPLLPQLTRLYLLALCILLPLLPCIGGYQALGERTYRLFYLLTIGYLAALAIICLELAFVGKCTLRALLAPLWRRSRSKLFLLLFLGWTILSALFSPFEGTWLGLGQHGGVLTTLLYGLLFLMVCAYGSWDFRFLHLLGGVVVFNAVIGLLQYAGLNPLYLYSDGTNFHDAFVLYNGAFLGTLGNVDLLSAFLCLTVPVFYSAFLLTGRKTALLPMGSGVFLLMLADVDSGYLGLAAGLLWRCLKHREQPPILFLLPGILAYLAQSCFTYSYCAVAALFWVFLALCEQTTNFQKEELEK